MGLHLARRARALTLFVAQMGRRKYFPRSATDTDSSSVPHQQATRGVKSIIEWESRHDNRSCGTRVCGLDVRQAWLEVQEARAPVKASREAVPQATDSLRMTRELYGADTGTSTQVLEAVALQIEAANNGDNTQLTESAEDDALGRRAVMSRAGRLAAMCGAEHGIA